MGCRTTESRTTAIPEPANIFIDETFRHFNISSETLKWSDISCSCAVRNVRSSFSVASCRFALAEKFPSLTRAELREAAP